MRNLDTLGILVGYEFPHLTDGNRGPLGWRPGPEEVTFIMKKREE